LVLPYSDVVDACELFLKKDIIRLRVRRVFLSPIGGDRRIFRPLTSGER
jgi:hypothetical protein